MSSSLRRGVAAAFFAFPLAGLTACGAGHDADTSQIRPDQANAHVDTIKVQNVNVVYPDGGDRAAVVARLFNDGDEDQTLQAVRLPGGDGEARLIPADGSGGVVVPAHGSVSLGGEDHAAAVIDDPESADISLGEAQELVFVLSETGDIELRARVVPDDGAFDYYGGWGPSPSAGGEESQAPGREPADGAEAGDEAGETGETGEPNEQDPDQGSGSEEDEAGGDSADGTEQSGDTGQTDGTETDGTGTDGTGQTDGIEQDGGSEDGTLG
ncbi:DUF461 domain-containing protein [Streptomyces sp. RFCAC02]|uniref:DUF461 domain-containing protein n=1 Tax=Streptomyces sp. RFCAC02 TaxID=2499143 RepID=UPI0010207BEA|nr:DUF461 domain-containing protein [Streptomyces sp. RFCAC02]